MAKTTFCRNAAVRAGSSPRAQQPDFAGLPHGDPVILKGG